MSVSEKMCWFAMRATYSRELDIKYKLDLKGINSFIPMRYEVRMDGKHKKRELVPVIHNLILSMLPRPTYRKLRVKSLICSI